MALTHEQQTTSLAEFMATPERVLAQNAVTRCEVADVLARRSVTVTYNNEYSNRALPKEMKATNQKSSGRCWLFACLNVLRVHMREKFGLADDFELSQAYLFFFDKLEKANFFLETVITTLQEPVDGRLMTHLLQAPLNDGGQFDMIVNLVAKYGVVPKSAYPESQSSGATLKANRNITQKLREAACRMRAVSEDGGTMEDVRAIKDKYMKAVHHMMLVHFGTPPTKFDWRFHDKDRKTFSQYNDITPQKFYEDVVGYDLGNCHSIINDPRNPYMQTMTVEYLGNVVDGVRPMVRHLNVESDVLRSLACKMIDAGQPVWFGCDVGKESHRTMAVMDTELQDYELVYGCKPELTKEERLRYGQSLMTHAMVLTAYDKKEGADTPQKWRVENSWGDDRGDKGYYMMTDPWFDEYLYQIVVPKEFLSEEMQKALEVEPTVLPAWDPMGALATTL